MRKHSLHRLMVLTSAVAAAPMVGCGGVSVPEPSSVMMLGAPVACLGLMMRRRRPPADGGG
jgi:hypothetical protein